MSYQIGQVIYVVLRKEMTIYPMQVVEIVTKKTLDGEVISYTVRAGSNPDKLLSIAEIDGEVFDVAEEAQRVLIDRATASIAQKIAQAVAKAREWYPSARDAVSDDPLELIKKTATFVGPPPLPANARGVRRPPRTEVAELAAELAAETQAQEGTMMQLPNGQTVKVRNVQLPENMK